MASAHSNLSTFATKYGRAPESETHKELAAKGMALKERLASEAGANLLSTRRAGQDRDSESDTRKELAAKGRALEEWPASEARISKVGASFCVPEEQDKVLMKGRTVPPLEAASKYKIHIPKKSDLPTDALFTQPPQRSSSLRRNKRPTPPGNDDGTPDETVSPCL